MQLSDNSAYTRLAHYQKPFTQPVKKPVSIPESAVEEGAAEKVEEIRDAARERNDALRQPTVGHIGLQSKKNRFDIDMNDISGTSHDTAAITFYQTLRDIEKQNNTVKAYAAYTENTLKG
ncbi:hypothetical protein [Hydrogenimonas sp. SS33]|uniref:hypothetical protein n=1 Tax=Hydrogenimonas leucolamina TaxID=2954236 RepID=UPI00336BE558